MDLRDASASKNVKSLVFYQTPLGPLKISQTIPDPVKYITDFRVRVNIRMFSLFKKSSILVLGVVPLVTRSSTERCLGIDSDKHLLNLMFSFTIFLVDSHNAVFRTITVVGQCVLL